MLVWPRSHHAMERVFFFIPFVLCAILYALCVSLVFPHLAACALHVFTSEEGEGKNGCPGGTRHVLRHKASPACPGLACGLQLCPRHPQSM